MSNSLFALGHAKDGTPNEKVSIRFTEPQVEHDKCTFKRGNDHIFRQRKSSYIPDNSFGFSVALYSICHQASFISFMNCGGR